MASTLKVQNIAHTGGTTGLTIDSTGRILTPARPAFRATSDNQTQSLSNTTNTVVIFDVAETNIGNCYNTSNGKFTAPIAGFYHFSASILVSNGGATRIDLSFHKNGSPLVAHEFRDGGATSTNASVTASCDAYLNATDYIEVITALHGANGSIYSEPKFWNFSGFLVG